MSSTDNRIVEMQFNNKRFESNAKETMSTLDKLKEKLNFKETKRDLDDFQNSADSFNLNRMADALESLGERFTLLGNIGQEVFHRIANAAVDAGEKILKSVFVDQIGAGMSKYEQETNAVQALYAALKPKGKSLEDIYEVLDLLTAYSDETSYSYTQMADGISKFVAAGQDINKSEKVMEGIANAAALAGVSISDAQIAFRNFSDAIAKGKFQLQDWKSIQNIHMDTEAFKNEVIKTAIELGKLEKGGYITVGSGKKAKKEQVTAANFGEYLRYGFFDSDVIMATMMKYADRTSELGDAAFKAAQQAKTFTDVLDAVKDAASTGWKTSFKIIFGDLNEAIDLFTPMANMIIEVVNDIDTARNTMLQFWKDLGGRSSAITSLNNLWQVVLNLKDAISLGFRSALSYFWIGSKESEESVGAFYETAGGYLYSFTKKIEDFTNNVWIYSSRWKHIITYIVNIISSGFTILSSIFDGIGVFLSEIFKQLVPSIDEFQTFLQEISLNIQQFVRKLFIQGDIQKFAKKLAKAFEPITSRLPDVIKSIRRLYNRVVLFLKTNKKFLAFKNSIKNVVNAFLDFIPKAIESLIQFGESIVETVAKSDEWKAFLNIYDKYIAPFLSSIVEGATLFNNALADFFNTDTSDEVTLWGKIKKRFSAFDQLIPWLTEKWEAIKKQFPWLQEVEDWWNTNPVINEIKEWVGAIVSALDTFLSTDSSGETSILGKIKMRFEAMWGQLGPWLEKKWAYYKSKWPILQQIEDFITGIVGWVKNLTGAGKEAENENENQDGGPVGFLQQLWGQIQEFVSTIDFTKVAGLAVVGVVLIKLYKAFKSIAAWTSIGETIRSAIENFSSTITEVKRNLKAIRFAKTMAILVEVAGSIWLLADSLVKLSQLSWEEISKGLLAMAGLFLEEGAFIVLMKRLTDTKSFGYDSLKFGLLLGVASSIWILADSLVKLSQLSWEEISKGLLAMAGLFLEEGAFMVLVKRLTQSNFAGGSSALKLTLLLGTAASMWVLADTLEKLSKLSWEEIGKGLLAMAGLFIEEGAFLILVTRLTSGASSGVGLTGMIGVVGSVYALANSVKDLSQLSWEEIAKGLLAMAGIFAEEGAFMVLLGYLTAKKILESANAATAACGVLGMGVGNLGKAMADLGKLSWEEIGKGAVALLAIEVILGAFAILMQKFGSIKMVSGTGTVLAMLIGCAAAIWILAQAFVPLAKIDSWDGVWIGLVAMAGIAVVLGLFCSILGNINSKITSGLTIIASAIAMAALMLVFAYSLTMIKDVDTKQIVAFGAMVALAAVAMLIMAGAITAFSGLGIGTATKGAIAMVIAAAGLAAAVALILEITGTAVQDFSGNIAVVGSNLALYSEQVEEIDMTAVNNSITMLKDIATAFVEVGAKNYGNLEEFKTNLSRMGAAIKLFYLMIEPTDNDKLQGSAKFLQDISAIFVEVGGKSYGNFETFKTYLTRAGSSLKIYSTSISAVDTEKITVSTGILKDISALFVEIGGKSYGNFESFKTYLTRIGSSLKTYNTSISSIDTSKIEASITFLKNASAGFVEIGGKDYGNFETFKKNLSRMGSTLKIFSTSVSEVDSGKIDTAKTTLSDISSLMVDVGGKDYSNYETFRRYLSRSGSSLKIFNTNIADLDFDKMKGATGALKQMGTDLTDFPEVKDVGTSVGYIGSAIKLYAESLDGVNLDEAPDTTAIQTVFNTLKGALPDDEHLTEVAAYATDEKGSQMVDFAIGLTAIATAVQTFSDDMKEVNFDNVDKAVAALTAINTINSSIVTTKIDAYGKFSADTAAQITDGALDTFAVDIVTLGTAVADFGNSIAQANFDNVDKAVAALVAINTINSSITTTKIDTYGKFSKDTAAQITDGALDTFATDIVTLGTAVADFGNSVAEANFDNVDKAIAALVAITTINGAITEAKVTAFGVFSAETKTQITEGSLDTFATDIVTLGTAVADFGNSVAEANFDNVDKAVAALAAISTLNTSLMTSSVTSFGSFSTETHTQITQGSLDTFATDITTLGTAVADFGTNVKDLNFDNISKSVDFLGSLKTLNDSLNTGTIVRFGPFSVELNKQVGKMATFSEDIVVLGTALKDFNGNVSDIDTDKMSAGVAVLGSIKDVNNALPKSGGLSQILVGSQGQSLTNLASNLKLLGSGVASFNNELKDVTIDAQKTGAAGAALVKIAEANGKLPKTGGLSSWLTGDENLKGFGESLGTLGEGVVAFVDALGDTVIKDNFDDALNLLTQLSDIQLKMSNAPAVYTIEAFAEEIRDGIKALREADQEVKGLQNNATDYNTLYTLFDKIADAQVKLGNTQYSVSVKQLGEQIRDFFTTVWGFTSTWTGGSNGKLEKLTESIETIFGTLNTTFDNMNKDDGTGFSEYGDSIIAGLTSGMVNEASKKKIEETVATISSDIFTFIKNKKNTTFHNAGTWIPAGFALGMVANKQAVIDAAKTLVIEAVNAAKEAAGIASPSRVFAEIGMYSDLGFAEGLLSCARVVDSAAERVSDSAIDSVLESMNEIQNLPIDDLEIAPTIRPVLDMSDISSGASGISDLFGNNPTVRFNTRGLEAQAQLIGSSTNSDISLITEQINEMSESLNELKTTMANLKIVLNNGVLVGELSSDIDKALGAKLRMGGRGN